MAVLALFGWVLLACAAPDLAPSLLGWERHAPDLFVALAVYLAVRSDGLDVVAWGIALGLAQDCVSLDPLGTHAFVVGLVTLLFARGRGSFERSSGLGLGFSLFGGTLLAHGLYVLRMIPVLREGPTLPGLLAGAPVGLWTTLWAWPLLALLEKAHAFDDLTGRRHGLSA